MAQKTERIVPTLDPSRGIELIKKQIDKIDEIINLEYNSPKVRAWESFTEELLVNVFGKPHNNLDNFRSTLHSGGPIRIGMSDQEWQENFVRSMQDIKELLASFTDQLELFAPAASGEKTKEQPKSQLVQNFYISQLQAQRIENLINIEEQPEEVKVKVEELLSELKKEKTKNKSKIAEIVKWLADKAIDVLIAIIAKASF